MKLTADLKFTSTFLAVIFLVTQVRASFEPLPVGGRAAGMGEAYSAIADDVFALYYNPAGVLQINRPEIGSYYSKLYGGLTDGSQISRMFIGYAQPLGKDGRNGGIGASYLSLNLDGLYKEDAIGLTYGREFRRMWNFGTSIKMLKKQIGSDEYTSNAIDPTTGNATGAADPLLAQGNSASAIALDLGLQYRLSRAYALGIAMRNINGPDLAIGPQKDPAPSVLALALARRLRAGSLDVEVSQWKGAESNTRFSVGGEHWFKGGLGLRAGGAFGAGGSSSASFGASYRFDSLQFDYATVLPLAGIEGTTGIQQLSFTVRLGRPPADPLETQLLKEKEERVRAETEARYAKAERDRLKKQLMALTEAKSQNQQDLERQAAQRALEDAKAQEPQTDRRGSRRRAEATDRALFNRYTAEVAEYNTRVSKGANLLEKKKILEKIIAEFDGKGLDTSTVTRELRSVRAEEAKAKKDFDLSMGFYRRLVQQGASVDERRSMLERIIQKYRGTGIEIGPAEDEMKVLK